MIDVYFEQKEEKMKCLGGISLLEKGTDGIYTWRVYLIYPLTDRTVLFQRKGNEFSVMDGHYEHEMGTITINYINDYMNINIRPKRSLGIL